MKAENLHQKIITSESGLTIVVKKHKEKEEWWVSDEVVRGVALDKNRIAGPIQTEIKVRVINPQLLREIETLVRHPEILSSESNARVLDPTDKKKLVVNIDPSTIDGINRFAFGWEANVPEPRALILDMKNIRGRAELVGVRKLQIPIIPEAIASVIYDNPSNPKRIKEVYRKKMLENGLTVCEQPNGPEVIYF